MDNMPQSTSTTTLSRRNSIGTPAVSTKLTITKSNLFRHHSSSYPKTTVVAALASSSSPPSFCYTSLKDVIPSSAVNSPTTASSSIAAAHPGYEIAIRNRLVKQAAWAYLQPVSGYPDSDDGSFFRRFWVRFSADLSKNSLVRVVTRAFGWFLRVIRVRSSE